MDFWTYLGEPFQYSFMTRAFVGVSLIALLAGILGTLIMLKGLAFIADAIAHAGFGGLVGALILGLPLQLGALSVGLATAIILTIIGRTTKLKEDTTLAILFTGAFSLGILGLATQPAFAGNLTAILVGSVLAISPQDIYWIGAVVLLTVGFVVSFLRQLVFICFDPMGAEAAGLPVAVLQLGLLSLIA
ncbi:MAG: metal ABC transporter permease, partial [Limnochordia bacterium]